MSEAGNQPELSTGTAKRTWPNGEFPEVRSYVLATRHPHRGGPLSGRDPGGDRKSEFPEAVQYVLADPKRPATVGPA